MAVPFRLRLRNQVSAHIARRPAEMPGQRDQHVREVLADANPQVQDLLQGAGDQRRSRQTFELKTQLPVGPEQRFPVSLDQTHVVGQRLDGRELRHSRRRKAKLDGCVSGQSGGTPWNRGNWSACARCNRNLASGGDAELRVRSLHTDEPGWVAEVVNLRIRLSCRRHLQPEALEVDALARQRLEPYLVAASGRVAPVVMDALVDDLVSTPGSPGSGDWPQVSPHGAF